MKMKQIQKIGKMKKPETIYKSQDNIFIKEAISFRYLMEAKEAV